MAADMYVIAGPSYDVLYVVAAVLLALLVIFWLDSFLIGSQAL